nr:MAG TPA: hypothetical protein [Caudoviricetes sp.]
MIPYLSKNFPCRSFIYARTEIVLISRDSFIYPLVLLYRVYEDDILWIKSIFWKHPLRQDMGKLITSCFLHNNWATCKVSFPSFF